VKEEIWKDINGYEGYYQISNKGNVRSLNRYIKYDDGRVRFHKGKNMKPHPSSSGYLCIKLSKNGLFYHTFLHRLIAEAFIENPNNLPIINHKDENPSNNSIENLEWCTYEYNNSYNNLRERRDATFKKRLIDGQYKKLTANSKKIMQFDFTYTPLKIWDTMGDIQRETGIKSGHISLCVRKKRNFAGKDSSGNYYRWMYYDEYIKLSDEEKEELHNKYRLKEVI